VQVFADVRAADWAHFDRVHFVKNVALMGTMLYIVAMGSGALSLFGTSKSEKH